MYQKLLLCLFVGFFLLGSCKKEDSAPANTFVINGVHDIDFGVPASRYLDLEIVQSSGMQEQVVLSVTGLPAGITVNVVPASGTPKFFASIDFRMTGNPSAGTYPIKIVGASASFSKAYEINLTIPRFSGFTVGGLLYRADYVYVDLSTPGVTVSSSDNGGGTLNIYSYTSFPTADGTYTYDLDGTGTSTSAMVVAFSSGGYGSYLLNDASGKKATLKRTGGKVSLSFPTIRLSSYYGSDYKDISADVRE
jgi:hypothetical protein